MMLRIKQCFIGMGFHTDTNIVIRFTINKHYSFIPGPNSNICLISLLIFLLAFLLSSFLYNMYNGTIDIITSAICTRLRLVLTCALLSTILITQVATQVTIVLSPYMIVLLKVYTSHHVYLTTLLILFLSLNLYFLTSKEIYDNLRY